MSNKRPLATMEFYLLLYCRLSELETNDKEIIREKYSKSLADLLLVEKGEGTEEMINDAKNQLRQDYPKEYEIFQEHQTKKGKERK